MSRPCWLIKSWNALDASSWEETLLEASLDARERRATVELGRDAGRDICLVEATDGGATRDRDATEDSPSESGAATGSSSLALEACLPWDLPRRLIV